MHYRRVMVTQAWEIVVGPTDSDEMARELVEQDIRDGELPKDPTYGPIIEVVEVLRSEPDKTGKPS